MPLGDENERNVGQPRRGLAQHILPSSGTMIGIAATLIRLIKILEGATGETKADEFAAAAAMIFLASAAAAYVAIRVEAKGPLSRSFERVADVCFLAGLVGLVGIAALFAFEAI